MAPMLTRVMLRVGLVDGETVGPPVVGVGVGPVVAGELVGTVTTDVLENPVGGVVGAGVGLVDDGTGVGADEAGAAIGAAVGLLPDGAVVCTEVGDEVVGRAEGAAVGVAVVGAAEGTGMVVGVEVGPGIGDRVSTLRSPKHLSGFDLRTLATSAVSEHASTSVTSPEPR